MPSIFTAPSSSPASSSDTGASFPAKSELLREKLDFLRSLPQLPRREPHGHKGTYGLSVLIGGSYGMSGSISLSGRAALTTGSGLVRICLPAPILSLVAQQAAEYMTCPVRHDSKGRISLDALPEIERQIASAKAVAIGPGLGQSLGLDVLVDLFYQSCPVPLVVDADALNALARRRDQKFWPPSSEPLEQFKQLSKDKQSEPSNKNNQSEQHNKNEQIGQPKLFNPTNQRGQTKQNEPRQKGEQSGKHRLSETYRQQKQIKPFWRVRRFKQHEQPEQRKQFEQYEQNKQPEKHEQNISAAFNRFGGVAAPRILTPHPGEFSRLTGKPTPVDSQGRLQAACEFARQNPSVILVLKGHETIVASGEKVQINQTGNPGMATGGSGDVLTGILTALLAQGLNGWDAACLGVALHGLAGDLALTRRTMESLLAGDLIRFLPDALNTLSTINTLPKES